jgi:hypothetical protein
MSQFNVRGLLWLMVIGACIPLMGCTSDPMDYKHLHFVIPDAFRGPIVIIEGRKGVVLDAEKKECHLEIPASGLVVVTSGAALREMRVRSASSVSGKPIAVDEPGDDEIALRSGGWADRTGHPPRFELFVGTLQEFEDFDFSKWTPAMSQAPSPNR